MLSMVFPAEAGKLVIMHTNDVHGNVRPERAKDRGGMLRAKVAIDSIRRAEAHTLLVDAGDDVQGFMYFTLFGGKVEYEMMNRMGYEVTTIGNHELDNGLDSLRRNYGILQAQVVNANYDFRGTPLEGRVQPFVIKYYEGKKIAIIGAGCDPQGMIVPKNYKGMGYRYPVELVDSIAGTLKAERRADYAIMLSHIGYQAEEDGLPCDSAAALSTRHIDLIIGGHSHTEIDPAKGNHQFVFTNGAGKRVLVAQTGCYGASIGKITVDLDHLDALPEYELLPVDSRYDGRYDEAAEAWLKPYDRAVEELMSRVIGRSAESMAADSNELRNWVADVLYEVGSKLCDLPVDAAITNKGGIRQPMPGGDVTQGQIMTMVPFPNCVLVMEMAGTTLQRCLDDVARTGGQAVSRQISFKAKGGKAVDARVGGRAIEPGRTYRIVTIDFVAEGGDRLDSFLDGKIVARSDRFMKFDYIDYVKALTAAGKTIQADHAVRMKNK